MNRRNKAPSKKIEFEPKVPTDQPKMPELLANDNKEVKGKPEEEKEIVNMMRGLMAPKTFANSKDFDINSNGFIMQIPETLLGGSIVVFNDGSLGIKSDGVIYECDYSYLGDGIAVEIGEKVKRIGDVDFILTGYESIKPEVNP